MRPLALVALAACGQSSGAPPPGNRAPMRFPVEVIAVAPARVEYVVNAVGSVDAFEKVQVTARVAGAVDRVLFSEGATVKDGQTLAEIETQRYAVAVAAAKAAHAKAQASLRDAELGLKRREDTVAQNPGLISGEELETFRTRVRTAQADEAAAKAALDRAQLDLRDAYVRAPVAGTIETRQVQTGQYLQVGAVLATLVRRDPLLLRFNVTEADAAQLRPGMIARFHVRSDEKDYAAKIGHVGGAADPQSRMVAVTALIGADEPPGDAGGAPGRPEGTRVLSPIDLSALRPGAFAEVAVPVGARADAVVIPQQAVRPSEKGLLAFVVDGDVARERIVKLGMRTADGKVEVVDGLKPGDRLVVRGGEALRDGSAVAVAGAVPEAGGK
jgi:multidrug efflux system membrane fusion protein